jgi:hypothetical protein
MTLPLGQALDALLWLTAISVLIQCAEALRLQAGGPSLAPWPWSIQRDDLAGSARTIRLLFDWLYRPAVHRTQLVLHALAAVSLPVWGPTVAASDFMTLVVLMGIAVGALATPWVGASLAWQAGLWVISIQALSSYFLSGTVKLRYAGWRNGRALRTLLDGGIYGPLPADSMLRSRPVAVASSWAFIVWEAAFPLAMIDPRITTLWCAIGAVFHFLVWWFFGLNRFFWAWLATFPALIGCATMIRG